MLSRSVPDLVCYAMLCAWWVTDIPSKDGTHPENKLKNLIQASIGSKLTIIARLGAKKIIIEGSVSLRTSLLWVPSRAQSQTANSTESFGQHDGPEPVCSLRRPPACLLCDPTK